MDKNGSLRNVSVGYLLVAMAVILFALMMASCGSGSGGGGDEMTQPATVSGSAVKQAVSDAEVKIFYFDETGNLIEIIAANDPVLTGPDGAYEFVLPRKAKDIAGPLIVKIVGGTMGDPPAAAPPLAAVIVDPAAPESKGKARLSYLSTASSVAAGLLQKQAEQSGAAPSDSDAEEFIRKVEDELGLDLSKHPADRFEGVAMFNEFVDQNLDLINTPENSPAINEYIDYLIANLASTSGKLDGNMDDPANPGTDIDADFSPFGGGLLASLSPKGPSSSNCLMCSADKTAIENDGIDYARLTCTARDAAGGNLSGSNTVTFEITDGRGIISPSNWRDIEDGQAEVKLSSVWAGNLTIEASLNIENGNTIRQRLLTNVTNLVEDVEDPVPPRVVSAGAISNTEVLVTFSEPIRGGQDGAEDSSTYRVSTSLLPGTESILNALIVKKAELLLPDRATVKLTTHSMADIEYLLTVLDVKDLSGNTFAPPERDFVPNTIRFTGIPPGEGELVDTDGDGVTDDVEQRGWIVTVSKLDGTTRPLATNSDPANSDTDGDGLEDIDEKAYNLNPRSADTDDDDLTDFQELNEIYSDPLDQDTDDDGLADGLEVEFFKTSPILADTDGDGFWDDEELLALSRNPRLADLPRPRIGIGDMALRLDTRFTFTDTQGVSRTTEESVATTLEQSDTDTFSFSDSNTSETAIQNTTTIGVSANAEVSGEGVKIGGSVSVENAFQFGFTDTQTTTANRESSETASDTFQESLTTSETIDETQEVTREVVGASLQVPLSIANLGDIPFTISNLEVVALLQDPVDRSRFLPVATLVPEITLDTGVIPEITTGPFIPERGPFIFASREVFPSLVEDLLRNPRGLVFQTANFDIVDEAGRNFAFLSQEVNDRTAGLVIDFGNRAERLRVATANSFDVDTGQPKGITLGFALQDILGLTKNGPPDAITVGNDGCGITQAVGDDSQAAAAVCVPMTPDGVVVTAGPDERIELPPRGDDFLANVCNIDSANADKVCSADTDCVGGKCIQTIFDGGDGCAQSTAIKDDVQRAGQCNGNSSNAGAVCSGDADCLVGGECIGVCSAGGVNGEIVLPGPNGVIDTTPAAGDELSTITGYATAIAGRCDDNSVDPGAACSVNADCQDTSHVDGVCQQTEILTRVQGVKAVREESRFWVVLASANFDPSLDFDAIPLQAGDRLSLAFVRDQDGDGMFAREEFLYGSSDTNVDTDEDELQDFDEVKIGWEVEVKGKREYKAFSDPVEPDSDSDRLDDSEELVEGTDPRKRDTDEDGISDFEELNGFSVLDKARREIESVVLPYSGNNPATGAAIVDGGDGIACTVKEGDDTQVISAGESVPAFGVIVFGMLGDDGTLKTRSNNAPQTICPGPNDDFEVHELCSACNIDSDNAGDACSSDTDCTGTGGKCIGKPCVQPGFSDHDERLFATDPLNADTDGDGLSDGVERALGANPNDRTDADDFRDTDRDGLVDAVEKEGWTVASQSRNVSSDPFEPDTDFDGLPDLLEHTLGSDPQNRHTDEDGLLDFDEFNPESSYSIDFAAFRDFEASCFAADRCVYDPTGSRLFGTSATNVDTDDDGRDDRQEIFEDWVVTVLGKDPRVVKSDPVDADADNDKLNDREEFDRGTDPANADTDGDKILDGFDPNPAGLGRQIVIRFKNWNLAEGDCDGYDEAMGNFDISIEVFLAPDDDSFGTKKSIHKEGTAHLVPEFWYFDTTFGRTDQPVDDDGFLTINDGCADRAARCHTVLMAEQGAPRTAHGIAPVSLYLPDNHGFQVEVIIAEYDAGDHDPPYDYIWVGSHHSRSREINDKGKGTYPVTLRASDTITDEDNCIGDDIINFEFEVIN